MAEVNVREVMKGALKRSAAVSDVSIRDEEIAAAVDAQIAALREAGVAMVPKKATQKMLDAGIACEDGGGMVDLRKWWAAMLAAGRLPR